MVTLSIFCPFFRNNGLDLDEDANAQRGRDGVARIQLSNVGCARLTTRRPVLTDAHVPSVLAHLAARLIAPDVGEALSHVVREEEVCAFTVWGAEHAVVDGPLSG